MNNNENNDFMNIKPVDTTQGEKMGPTPNDISSSSSTISNTNTELSSGNNEIPQDIIAQNEPMNSVVNDAVQTTQTPNMQTVPPMMNTTSPVQESTFENVQNEVPIGNSTVPFMQQNINQENTQNPFSNPQQPNPAPPVYNQNMGMIPPSNNTSINQKPSFFSKNGKYILLALFVIILLLVGIFLFSGKKLICTSENEFSGVRTSQSIQVKFNGDKPNRVKMIMSMDLKNIDEELKGMKESLIEGLKEDVKVFEEDGLKVDIKETTNTITVIVSGSEKLSTLLDMNESKLTFDQIKKQFETGGYTCK